MTERIFSDTPRFARAVGVINKLEASKFPKLLTRIVLNLHNKDTRAFSVEEEEKLTGALDLLSDDLNLMLETLEFAFQQAAYYGLKANVLHQHLTDSNIESSKSEAIVKAWVQHGKVAVDKMKKHSFAPRQLESVSWNYNLQLAQDSRANMKESNAIFHLNLSDKPDGKSDKIVLQFSHEELLGFYEKLETIQHQLDSLS